MAEEFVSFSRALRELQMQEPELKRLVSEGEIRAFRDQDKMKFKLEDLERFKRARAEQKEEVPEELVFEEDDDAGMSSPPHDDSFLPDPPPPAATTRRISLTTAARRLRIRESELRALVRAGRIQAEGEGSQMKFDPDEVARFRTERDEAPDHEEADTGSGGGFSPPRRPFMRSHEGGGVPSVGKVLLLVGSVLIGVLGISLWFNCQIVVPKDNFIVLVKKDGKPITNDMVIAMGPEFQGVQHDIVKEGRHWYNPYEFDILGPYPATIVPNDQVGIVTRLYGEDLLPGQLIAETDTQKGILRKTLGPGPHYVNPSAYDVDLGPATKILPGYMGIEILLEGDDPTGTTNMELLVSKSGEKGVQPRLYSPGTYYTNRWITRIIAVDMRACKFEMKGDAAIDFPSLDGFVVHVEGTVEFAINEARLPEVFSRYIDADLDNPIAVNAIPNIVERFVLPLSRSFSRTIGSGHVASDFILGQTRSTFQAEVEKRLKEHGEKEGIEIRSVVFSICKPPEPITDQYRAREVARQRFAQYIEEVKREDARKMQALQEQAKQRQTQLGEVRKAVAVITREAEQRQSVQVTEANKELEVARKDLEAATKEAEAIRLSGLAEAEVVVMNNTAEANGLRAEVEAFGDGGTYARHKLLAKIAPALERILSNTDGPLADLLRHFTAPAPAPEAAKK